jgi:hypothetical protein
MNTQQQDWVESSLPAIAFIDAELAGADRDDRERREEDFNDE